MKLPNWFSSQFGDARSRTARANGKREEIGYRGPTEQKNKHKHKDKDKDKHHGHGLVVKCRRKAYNREKNEDYWLLSSLAMINVSFLLV